jgi:hypothetical protein
MLIQAVNFEDQEYADALRQEIKTRQPDKMTDTDRLYVAIKEYIENRGGKVVVIGGIEIQQRAGALPYNYAIAVQFTGTKPKPIEEGEDETRRSS